ncbi:unnamed protein product [Schistocephalus solidus]|uniref:Kelch repeat protein n=1 Tax=Schistocephalus solidus TaxID=70667 RepID=A0A183TNZ5_SCHSO|nr:unnamed protein product [Schistocephalus solidus]
MAVIRHNSIILYGQSLAYSPCRLERYDPDDVNNEDLGPLRQQLHVSLIGIGATSLAYPRKSAACCYVAVRISVDRVQTDNGIIICGGENNYEESQDIVELFIPRQNRIRRLPPMQISRSAGAAVSLPDGRVFVAGGRDYRYIYAEAEYANVEFCNWQGDWQTANESEFWHEAAPMMDPRTNRYTLIPTLGFCGKKRVTFTNRPSNALFP